MDSMKHALKKHMSKVRAPVEGDPAEEKAESPKEEMKEKLLGDKAPALHEHNPMMSGIIGPEHVELLKQLLAQISHPGRDAMSLEERSAPALKAHLGSIGKVA